MAVVTPPQITPPPLKPQRGDKATFRERVDDFITWMIAVVAQFAALALNVFNNAQDAAGSAGAANTSATNANTAKTGAETARTGAETARTGAETARTGAETARTQAQAAAAALRGTSVNALTIGVGSKSLTTETGRQFDAGQTLKLVVVGNGEAWMSGRVTSYNSATGALVVNVLAVASAYAGQGSNTWNLYVAGEVGPTGPMGGLSGGNLTGALNTRQGPSVPVSNVPDIWSGGGNLVVLDNSGTITGFSDAPQIGAQRTVLVYGTVTLTHGTDLIVYGGTQTLAAGDLVDVLCEERVNKFRATIRKRDGTPVQFNQGAFHNLRICYGSSLFTAPKTGWYKITCTGGSGSAGGASVTAGNAAGATGAGAGGFISGMRYLTAGVTYIVTVGAGGAGFTLAASATPIGSNGNSGSASSFSGSGITTMTANGGTPGQHTGNTGVSFAASPGGTATGAPGDMAVTGGAGGAMGALVAGALAASGGGAVGIRGTGYQGGYAQATTTSARAAAGGAGVGGKGGNAASSTATARAAGGGCTSAAADVADGTANTSQAGANFQGTPAGQASFQMPNDLDSATGGGGLPLSGTGGTTAPAGGGSGGEFRPNPGSLESNSAGFFAGAGGLVAEGSSFIMPGVQGQKGGAFGGAPGGVVARTTSGNTAQVVVPDGSTGSVTIEW